MNKLTTNDFTMEKSRQVVQLEKPAFNPKYNIKTKVLLENINVMTFTLINDRTLHQKSLEVVVLERFL